MELLERDAELAAIDAAMDSAIEGSGGAVLVVGEAGLGKTSLLDAATDRGRDRGMRILRARGEELEREFPWGVAVQLFAGVARERDADELLSGAAGLARELLDGAVPSPGSRPDPFPLMHALHWLAVGLSERGPLLVLLDDAHWSDVETLRYLSYLLGRIREAAICVIATERPGDPVEPGGAEILARLRAHDSIRTRTLKPLGSAAVAQLVRGDFPDASGELCSAIEEVAGGNPFLTRKLALAAREEGLGPSGNHAERLRELQPEAIRSSILVRLSRLGEDAARFATAASILGPGAPPRVVCDLAGLEERAASTAAAALTAAGILEAGERVGFAHPIVREVVYAGIAPLRRAREHLTAARLLHQSGAPVEEVAAQLLRSEPVAAEWAISSLREAAARAAARGALGSAERLLRQALAGVAEADPSLLFELGAVETALGAPAAAEHLETAAHLAGDARQRAMILGSLAAARYAAGDTAGVVAATRSALDEIPPGGGGSVEAELLFNYGMAARALPPLVDDLIHLLEQPRSGPTGDPTPAEVVRLMLRGFDEILRGGHGSAARSLGRAVEYLADEPLAREVSILAQITLEEFRALLGQTREAEAAANRHVQAARGRGSRLETAIALEARAGARWFGGDLPGALADAELALTLSEHAWDAASVVLRVVKAGALLERDELDAAAQTLDVPESVEERLPGSWGWFWLPYARGRLAFARGLWPAARQQALLAGERLFEIAAPAACFVPWRGLASQAQARLGERDEAVALAREEVELARGGPAMPFGMGIALANLGSLEPGEEGLAALRESIHLLGASSARLEHAKALIELGAALRRGGWDRDARDSLWEGLERARACEARALIERAAEELAAAGARPRSLALTGVESLTPSERRVAEMAAEGLSNREIAEALFVTRRTVETHLTHAYSKLGITSRGELREAMPRPSTGR